MGFFESTTAKMKAARLLEMSSGGPYNNDYVQLSPDLEEAAAKEASHRDRPGHPEHRAA